MGTLPGPDSETMAAKELHQGSRLGWGQAQRQVSSP